MTRLRVTSRTFSSRIGRRWFLVLLGLGCGPLLLSALFAYQRISTELEAQALSTLRADSKYIALTTLENLRRAATELGHATPSIADDPALIFVDAPRWYSGTDNAGADSAIVAAVAAEQRPRVVLQPVDGERSFEVLVGVWNDVSREVAVGTLAKQWIALPPDMLRPNVRVCVAVAEQPFYCVEDTEVGLTANPAELLTARWDLFLGGEFGAGTWQFTAAADRASALSAATVLRRAIFLGFAMIAVAAVFIGVRMVRTMVRPIEALQRNAKQLEDGNLRARAVVETDDELGDLATAFNSMATNLERRFRDSRALARLDRRLLEARSLAELGEATVTALAESLPGSAHALVIQTKRKPLSTITFALGERGAVVAEERHGPMLARLADSDVTTHRGVARRTIVATHWPAAMVSDEPLYSLPVRIDGDIAGALLSLPAPGQSATDMLETAGVVASRVVMAMRTLRRDEQLEYQAFVDVLTGLPNRRRFQATLADTLADSARSATSGAILFIDLDHFKQINDLAGHRVGDRVLKAVAERLGGLLDASDMLARFGGDEFCMLLHRCDADIVEALAKRSIEVLAEPITIDGASHFAGGSIGIASFPDDGREAEALIAAADAAMYSMKESGRGGYRRFDPSMLARSQRRADVERQLHVSLQTGSGFSLVYQPKIDCASGAVTGLEALLRWRSERLGAISPAEFIPIAEESGLIGRIGLHVQELAAADLKYWTDHAGDVPMPVVSINASPRQLSDSTFAKTAASVFNAVDIPAPQIEFEVTETAFADDETMMLATLDAIRDQGFTISIDDFGSGISSLAKLVEIPFDTLKVDQSFVASWQPGNKSEMIIRTVVGMAHEMGKTVVAEGVETEEQFAFLASIGCDLSQGYLHARPMPLADIIDYVREANQHMAVVTGTVRTG